MRKTLLCCLMLCVVVGFASLAWAGKKTEASVDMGAYTCQDLAKENSEDIGLVLMWVDGYISCESGELTMNETWIMEMATYISEACVAEPSRRLIDIVKELAEEEE